VLFCAQDIGSQHSAVGNQPGAPFLALLFLDEPMKSVPYPPGFSVLREKQNHKVPDEERDTRRAHLKLYLQSKLNLP